MGNNKSSHANTNLNTEQFLNQEPFQSGESVGGLKTSTSDSDVTPVSFSEHISLASDFSDFDDSESEDESEEETNEEFDEFLAERRMILEDAAMLKKYATFHLNPEQLVVSSDPTASGRNFFMRQSAPEPEQESVEESEERAKILEEAALLKKYAEFHLHHEKSIVSTDPTSCGRNYFSRPSADEYLDAEEEKEHVKVLEEAVMLKKYATFHLHPEQPVVSSDPTASGRNFFMRQSAPEQESAKDTEIRAKILEEAWLLKKYAEFHLHPEEPVISSDSTSCGCNYFSRPSADEYFDAEEEEECTKILEEAAMLKKYATFHLHPEKPVVLSDPTASGRNFFMRESAPKQESAEDSEERENILEEVALLKKYAEFHLHPEEPVVSSDSTSCGRNYFSRPSADKYFDAEEEKERAKILEEVAMLQKYAEFHLHPEKPVVSSDPIAGGRNYFCRSAAPLNDIVLSGKSKNDTGPEIKQWLTQGSIKHTQVNLPHPTIKHSTNDGNEVEEGNMNRSPSSIMLFGYEDNEAF